MTTLAHVSDLHATSVEVRRVADFLGKRALGWLSWRLRRRHHHRPEALEALVADLHAAAPDHAVVTGDVTNVACEHEFEQALAWLERLGGPQRLSVIPGNHDAYAAVARERSLDLWQAYLASDGAPRVEFPAVRIRGGFAIVGLSSAHPTAPFLAQGSVGEAQLERLERRLRELSDTSLCRVVLVHHPVTEGAVSPRRALLDADRLRAVLARTGADLVLHGHGHRTLFGSIPGPEGPIPVVGARSASDASPRPEKTAQYHLYDVAPWPRSGSGPRFRIRARIRGYDEGTRSFAPVDEREL
jgi:3',5'-cyclic AMP phosphodiesterase CpdA